MTRGLHPAALAAVWLFACIACRGPAKNQEKGPKAPGVLAMVGEQAITASAVIGVSRAQGVGKREALAVLTDAGLLRQFYEAEHPTSARYLRRIALARAASEEVLAQGKALGPVSDAELAEFTGRHWKELARPAAVRTSHVVVLLGPEEDDGAARKWLARLRDKLTGAQQDAAFRKVAEAEPHEGLEVRVEALPPVAADGRVVDLSTQRGGGTFDPHYTQAAHSLAALGDVSEPVRTAFGLHLIYLAERQLGRNVTGAERRRLAVGEITAQRARRLEQDALTRLLSELEKAGQPVSIDDAALSLMERVRLRK